MGQAKQRGTFEQRCAAAIERDNHRRTGFLPPIKPMPKTSVAVAGAGSGRMGRAMSMRMMLPLIALASLGAIPRKD